MQDKFIGRFKSLGTLQSYANNADDMDLQSRIKLVLQYHSRIPSLIDRIQRSAIASNGGKIFKWSMHQFVYQASSVYRPNACDVIISLRPHLGV